MSEGKHVIFLGAGASVTSGYPDANKLRLLMTSPKFLNEKIAESVHLSGGDAAVSGKAQRMAPEYREKFKDSIELLREGGFGTVDEFSKLASASSAEQVQDLKKWMRFCLAIHDPELTFDKSDYYPFLQRLFLADAPQLRNDISVLSFNYDPYLEFLLLRAYIRRCKTANQEPDLVGDATSITSGFYGRHVGNLESGEGFCLLKLHGTIALPHV